MTRSSHVHRAAAGLAAALATGVLAAPGAAAAEPAQRPQHLCSTLLNHWGMVDGEFVDGDLVVDTWCSTSRAHVTGDVVVRPDTAVYLDGTTVDGDVRALPGGAVDYPAVTSYGSTLLGDLLLGQAAWISDTTVHGDLVLDAAGERVVTLERARVRGSVHGRAGDVTLVQAAVLGSLDVTTTLATRSRDSVVAGDLTARGGRLVVHDTSVHGALTADATADVLVCRTSVGADLTVRGVRLWSRVGEERAEWCRTTVGGSVHVHDNPSSVILGDLRVAGDLTCSGNAGSLGVVRRPALVVAGTRSPDCT